MSRVLDFLRSTFSWVYFPKLTLTHIIEIILLAVIIYQILKWFKNTRAWSLFKGIIVIVVFVLMAYLLNMTIILWIFTKTFNVIIIALFIVFQPELRRALEQLGRRNLILSIIGSNDYEDDAISHEKRNNEIVKATFEMSKTMTGALIVVEHEVLLSEYERTGITLDSLISSQLLINIFEHNTPLHDGAVFIRKNRIIAATCYLPLSDNMELSKSLGTRHRAALGISEVSDSLTIVVSEETGKVSIAKDGKLIQGIDSEELKAQLKKTRTNPEAGKLKRLKGIIKNEKKTNK